MLRHIYMHKYIHSILRFHGFQRVTFIQAWSAQHWNTWRLRLIKWRTSTRSKSYDYLPWRISEWWPLTSIALPFPPRLVLRESYRCGWLCRDCRFLLFFRRNARPLQPLNRAPSLRAIPWTGHKRDNRRLRHWRPATWAECKLVRTDSWARWRRDVKRPLRCHYPCGESTTRVWCRPGMSAGI